MKKWIQKILSKRNTLKSSNDTLSKLVADLKKEVNTLKQIVKENFIYSPVSSRPIDFKHDVPEMKQEIIEILLEDR